MAGKSYCITENCLKVIMMDVFVARQPIFDREKILFGYELLFREGNSNVFPDIDGDTATTSLLSSSFFTVGIDRIAVGKPAFINFTEDLIKEGTPHLFPQDKLVVEILESVSPDPKTIQACRELKEQGYMLALDDFVYSGSFDELLELVDIVKIDFRLTSRETIETMITSLLSRGCKILAEKIETYEEFNAAASLGFQYFQGYFFSRPEILKNKELSASQLIMLQLLAQLNSAEFDISTLEELVIQDVSISYKLLNYLNSAHFSRLQPISSIKQAISFLGEKSFKLFVSLIVTSKLAENKPLELIRLSIVRARFLELVGIETGRDSSEMFLLGLFSLIDAMLDKNMEEIFSKLPLSWNIQSALLHRQGELFFFLRLLESYETGNWVAFKYAHKKAAIDSGKVVEFYLESLRWAESFNQE
ncbi:EAL and HDOD domain-containing protein [Desulfopila inferna]|mgnify:CR=1 FL=1|uniref:EAL and HDOD domain-containing protein n=1 Tax=Desulfopila inferna TaxID=468528 RepID=UPI0019634F02|nr:EAL domain-containing protein [Desulfopila inferna]MBM9602859.1 EAL domain-containing protein [Desulfopila inferna]